MTHSNPWWRMVIRPPWQMRLQQKSAFGQRRPSREILMYWNRYPFHAVHNAFVCCVILMCIQCWEKQLSAMLLPSGFLLLLVWIDRLAIVKIKMPWMWHLKFIIYPIIWHSGRAYICDSAPSFEIDATYSTCGLSLLSMDRKQHFFSFLGVASICLTMRQIGSSIAFLASWSLWQDFNEL